MERQLWIKFGWSSQTLLQSANKSARVGNIQDIQRKQWPKNVSSDFYTDTQTEGHKARRMDGQKDRQTDGQMEGNPEKETEKETDKGTQNGTDRQPYGLEDGRTGGRTDIVCPKP